MRKTTHMIWVALLALALASCAVVDPMHGKASPDTPEETLAYLVATNTAIANSTREALEADRITPDTAADVLRDLDNAAAYAEEAAALLDAGDVESAEGRLQLAEQILVRLEARLAEQEAQGDE